MATRFFTNDGDNTLLNKFKGVFRDNADIRFFDVLVGYFRSSGYFAIRPYLENVPHIRVLAGIDVDHILARYHEDGLLFKGDDEATKNEALKKLREDIETCGYKRDIENGICLFVEDVVRGKVEIRAHKTRKLHAKIYIFRPEHWTEHHPGSVITGSSNLTAAGLGADRIPNYEFNVQLHEYDDVAFATSEFGKLWDEATPILPEHVKALKEKTHLNDQVTPFELYVKMLASYFGNSIDYNPDTVDMPPNYRKLSYQIDAVNQGYDKLCKYNGFFLADVVGLGKTVVALMTAKKFFYGNGFPEHISKILIICPPAVQKSWENTADDFGLKTCKIITCGSIHKEEKRFNAYDLIIVDEAHKFRTATANCYSLLQRLCKSPAPAGGTLGKNPECKKVILISATPLNNGPEDIKNQTYLFQDGGNTDLDIPNLEAFFNDIIKRYKDARKLPISESRPVIQEVNAQLRDNVIFPLTIRRTRADLMNNQLYREDLKKQGIIFPESKPPVQMFYKMSGLLDSLFDRTLECLKNKLNYSRYQAIVYLKPEASKRYINIASTASEQLSEIMKNILVKRLDSSFYAFKLSLKHFLNGVEAMLKMLNNNRVFIQHGVNVTDLVLNGDESKLANIFEQMHENDPASAVFAKDDFKEDFIPALQKDKDELEKLWNDWEKVDEDPKYDEFLSTLKSKFLNKRENPSGKVVVFSEAEDTTMYLKNRLGKDGIGGVLAVHAGNRDRVQDEIAANFDANICKAEQKDDYNVIICTEVLAEGVNLHRAGLIVNYDTPWNSTRLMQRVGRINRIGSKNKSIAIYNFFPTSEVNSIIELEKKASMKLLAFHHALGSDSQIYSPDDEEPGSFGLFSTNCTEERDERLSHLLWLREFRNENPDRFKMIVDLPLKIRAGRCENDVTHSMFPAEATVAYLKNARRDLFFAVSGESEPKVISFLEAEKMLHCREDEPRQPVPDIHYRHIGKFMDGFEKQHQEMAGRRQAPSSTLNPQEKKALNCLKALSKTNIANDDEQRMLERAAEAIRQQKFSNLHREINKISGNRTPLQPSVIIPKVMEVIGKYLYGNSQKESQCRDDGTLWSRPCIVISETFVSRPIEQ